MIKGIDISHWQGKVNFEKVKSSGVEFIILKAGGSDYQSKYKDKKFEEYYKKCKELDIPVGAYFFAGNNVSSEKGFEDAAYFENLLKNKQFEMPVYIDFEMSNSSKKNANTEYVVSFCQYMESKGFFVGIYASDISGFKDRLNDNKLKAYTHWVARYGNKPKYVKEYAMWQKSSTGKIDGINTNVDIDECYTYFPGIIKKGGYNGY